jgi:hypothetical protein
MACSAVQESYMGKMRSPNFPTIPLGQAIDLVGKIHREDRQNAIDKEVAAKHMGYTGLTGRTLKLMGALSQYGLIDKVAKGQIRVSKTAVSILHWSDDAERREAIAKAGTSPVLFRRIRDSFDDPSERTITSYLIKEGFTDTAVPAVLKSYRETNRFLAEAGVSESYGTGALEDADSPSDEEEDEDVIEATPMAPTRNAELLAAINDGAPLDFKISSGRLTLVGSTVSPAAAKAFLPKLQAAIEFFALVGAEPEQEGGEA